MGLQLLTILAHQSHIVEVIIFSEEAKCSLDIFLVIIPLEQSFSDISMMTCLWYEV